MSRVWDESLNPYDVLEIANGLEASEADIKKVPVLPVQRVVTLSFYFKAYRKLARLKHPDKNPTARIEGKTNIEARKREVRVVWFMQNSI